MANNSSPEAVVEQLVRGRISLLLHQPFWGTLAVRLILKDATDDPSGWCTTAATDGRYFYYNREFISKLTKDEVKFLWGHEVEHCVYDHMGRVGSRNKSRWNAAADFVINAELVEYKVGSLPNPATCGVTPCYDDKYKGKTAEEVYDELGGGNYPEFDVHITPGDGNGEPITDDERRMLGAEIRNAVLQAAKAAGSKTPNSIKKMLKDLIDPQMDWREHLNMKIQSTVKADFTWQRCSRKMQSSGIYLPAMSTDFKVKAAFAIDCSGSMSDTMLRDLLSEVKGVMQQFPDFDLDVWCFNTSVFGHVKYTPENINDIDYYEIGSSGGTDFVCNWEYMKENDIVPERFVMMTDGYPNGSWGDPLYCDTLFIIHSDPKRHLVSPFGDTAYYEPRDNK